MAKNRDWVDYANVAANVVQAAQLGSINDKMRQMAELQREKDYREQQEAAVAKCEDLLREAVFVYSEQLRDLEDVASESAVVTYIRANHLKGAYGRMPQFQSSGLRKFEDKERLANAQRGCERLIRESAARLQPDERETCDRCVAHILERDDLLRLISAQEEKEQLARDRDSLPAWKSAKQAELKRAKQEQWATTPLWFKIVFTTRNVSAYCSLVGSVWMGIVYSFYTNNEPPFLMTLPLWLLATTPVLFLTYIIVVFSPPERRRREFEERRSRMIAEIGARGFELSQREAALKENEHVYAKVGTTSAQGSRKLLAERDELLVQVAGDSARSFVQRKEPLGDVSL